MNAKTAKYERKLALKRGYRSPTDRLGMLSVVSARQQALEVGDRVCVYYSPTRQLYGVVKDVRPDEVLVQLDNGRSHWVGPSRCSFEPSEKELQSRIAAVFARWSDEERKRRFYRTQDVESAVYEYTTQFGARGVRFEAS